MTKEFARWLRNIFPKIPRYYNRLQIKGIKNLPKQGSAIICPNHSGGMNYDSLCLMSLFDHFNTSDPSRKRIWLCFWDLWVSKKEPWATILQQFSPIPISLTGGGIPYDLVDKIVERGELIAIMPEGRAASIQEGYNLWKFYPGVIKLHLRYEIPIIP
ncbi:MAG: 1-acyl-sn-glycerol-3-phosphate acyltransferase, partial [Promethearchaeota archaeon]